MIKTEVDSQVFVKKAPGVSMAAALAAVRVATKSYPGTSVMDQTAFKAERAKPVQQTLALVYTLLALAIVIACSASATRWRCPSSSAPANWACCARSG